MFFGFLLLLAGLVYLEANQPPKINWFPSYTKQDKIPYGTFVVHDLIKDQFNSKLVETDIPPFEFLDQPGIQGSYIFVNNKINFEKAEIDKLLNWTSKGNILFIAANYLEEKLLDTLNLKMATEMKPITEPLVTLVNENISEGKTYHMSRNVPIRYFSQIDTATQTVLGNVGIYKNSFQIQNPKINFLKAPFKKGTIILHSQPEMFTNLFLLEDSNANYTAAMLSYINNKENFYWDNYYKTGKSIDVSPLRVLLQNRSFKWAYYFVLLGILLFIFFEGRRKQRSIPIIKPLENKTFQYTQTVAGMYLEQQEYQALAQKEIALFLEYIRTKLRLSTEKIDIRFLQAVAERSGNALENTENLFKFFNMISSMPKPKKEDLITLHEKIDTFKNAEIIQN